MEEIFIRTLARFDVVNATLLILLWGSVVKMLRQHEARITALEAMANESLADLAPQKAK